MQAFVSIKILSKCCQTYGICGEQYSGDIIFDDFGTVTATGSATPVLTQVPSSRSRGLKNAAVDSTREYRARTSSLASSTKVVA